MYELIQLTDRTYYIKTPTNVGVIRTSPNEVCLIDSGRNEDEARLTYERIREKAITRTPTPTISAAAIISSRSPAAKYI